MGGGGLYSTREPTAARHYSFDEPGEELSKTLAVRSKDCRGVILYLKWERFIGLHREMGTGEHNYRNEMALNEFYAGG